MDSARETEQIIQHIIEINKRIEQRINEICERLTETNKRLEEYMNELREQMVIPFNRLQEDISERLAIQYEPQDIGDILFPPSDDELKGGG